MKIRVEFTVDIDADVWCEVYGIGKPDVRDDVRSYIENSFYMHCADEGLLSKGGQS